MILSRRTMYRREHAAPMPKTNNTQSTTATNQQKTTNKDDQVFQNKQESVKSQQKNDLWNKYVDSKLADVDSAYNEKINNEQDAAKKQQLLMEREYIKSQVDGMRSNVEE